MSILAVGSEDSDFEARGPMSVTTNPGYFRANYVRCALASAIGAGTNQDHGWYLKFPVPQADFWLTARFYSQTIYNSDSVAALIGFMSDEIQTLALRLTQYGQSNPFYELVKIDGVGVVTILDTATSPIYQTTLTKLDFHVNYAVAGFVRVYVDGRLVLSYDGDVTTDGRVDIDTIRLADANRSVMAWSEVILADEDTRNMSLARLIPLAAGNAQQWDGVVGDVNEVTINDSTFVTTDVVDELAQFTVTPSPAIGGTLAVKAVVVAARAAKGATGPTSLKMNVRTNGADYDSAALPLDSALGPVKSLFALNPNTGLAWTTAELVSGGFNIGVKASA